MYVNYGRRFKKQYSKVNAKTQKAFEERLLLFKQNPFHPRLNNHSLTGKFNDYRSINITGDIRAIFRESKKNDELIIDFEFLGTHSQLYK